MTSIHVLNCDIRGPLIGGLASHLDRAPRSSSKKWVDSFPSVRTVDRVGSPAPISTQKLDHEQGKPDAKLY